MAMHTFYSWRGIIRFNCWKIAEKAFLLNSSDSEKTQTDICIWDICHVCNGERHRTSKHGIGLKLRLYVKSWQAPQSNDYPPYLWGTNCNLCFHKINFKGKFKFIVQRFATVTIKFISFNPVHTLKHSCRTIHTAVSLQGVSLTYCSNC